MKKTIHINLNGFAYTIDEDAYEVLHRYLNQIETSFSDKDEAKEIVADIEARISELFQSNKYTEARVITLRDVEEVIKTMGDPNDFCDDSEQEESSEQKAEEPTVIQRKRLYRDSNNRVISGVCGGLGAYFDIDPLVFRVIFFVAIVFYGVGLPLYIILWIVMPKALTLTQKMEMRGAVNYDKWEQNIKRGFNNVKNSKAYEDISTGAARTSDSLGDAFRFVIRFLVTILGVVLMLGTLLFMLGIVISFAFGFTFFDFTDFNAYYSMLPNFFVDSSNLTMGLVGILLITVIPVLFIFFVGFKMVFKIKARLGILALIGLVLWFVGIGMVVVTSGKTFKDFASSSNVMVKDTLSTQSKTLYLKSNKLPDNPEDGNYLFEMNRLTIYDHDGELKVYGEPKIELVRGEQLDIEVNRKARGRNRHVAEDNCNDIEYFYLQKDSVLFIDPVFTLKEGSKLRDQKVKVIITVPDDMNVEVDNELVDVVSDQLVELDVE